MKHKTVWVLTFNGAAARIFKYGGAPRRLEEIVAERRDGPHKPQFDDRAARVHESAGPGRSAIDPRTDAERRLEDAFAGALAEDLATRLAQGAFDELVIAAGPRALGAFRAAAPRALAEKIVRETPGDYVNADPARLLLALEGEKR